MTAAKRRGFSPKMQSASRTAHLPQNAHAGENSDNSPPDPESPMTDSQGTPMTDRGTPGPDEEPDSNDLMSVPPAPIPEDAGPVERANNTSTTRPSLCLLVVGPAGSGKSAFIAKLVGRASSDAMIGHNTIDSHTTTVTPYTISHPSATITLLDTPALSPDTFLSFLTALATHIQSSSAHSITGVILTHPITLNRLTNTTRQSLNLLKSICGPSFFASQTLLLTTMWDQVSGSGSGSGSKDMETLTKREAQLLSSPNFWSAANGSSGKTVRFYGADENAITTTTAAATDSTTSINTYTTAASSSASSSASLVIDHFLNMLLVPPPPAASLPNRQKLQESAASAASSHQPRRQPLLQFEREIKSGLDVPSTTAGRLVLEDKQGRRAGQQEEAEREARKELERLRAEQERLKREKEKRAAMMMSKRMSSSTADISRLGFGAGGTRHGTRGGGAFGASNRQYEVEDGMAYGPIPGSFDDDLDLADYYTGSTSRRLREDERRIRDEEVGGLISSALNGAVDGIANWYRERKRKYEGRN
ncbi:hypothetical protein QBC42DRAFT_294375 [Cladorrhinum samala]|uniref:G domain-containing protein n=1 Tax=Cladorrhinum samala TaxID=585594 RepID=A0AAV9HZI3_9PEZI|nr:hypothetical protein QBC42DRAFT_294375 [Cladorrhinum samala]